MTYEEYLAKIEAHKNDVDYCPRCGEIEYGLFSKSCLKCNCKMLPYTGNIPSCPTCGSVAIKKISGISRVAHGAAFGLFSKTARSQWECRNCGNKW